MRILLVDNYDSFTYNLVDYFRQAGAYVQVVTNSVSIEKIITLSFDALVLSPGPGTPEESGNVMDLIHYYEKRIPILGICLGHQAIGQYYGWTLEKATLPMHGKTSLIYTDSHRLFDSIQTPFKAMRYHSLILNKTNTTSDIQCIARTEQDEIMMIQHKHLPITGMQFHPESILTPCGKKLLFNWIQCIAKTDNSTIK